MPKDDWGEPEIHFAAAAALQDGAVELQVADPHPGAGIDSGRSPDLHHRSHGDTAGGEAAVDSVEDSLRYEGDTAQPVGKPD